MSSNNKVDYSKLVLFDIDGTLIFGDGASGRALLKAMEECLHISFAELKALNFRMSGKTDPQNVKEIMLAHYDTKPGASFEHRNEEEWQIIIDKVLETYLLFLPGEIANTPAYRLLEGVLDLLNAIRQNERIAVGLLTGNVERGARIKLEQVALHESFPIGAYGSDSHDRLNLPQIASKRAEVFYKTTFRPEQIIIIGDAENDVLCAKHYGAISLAVNTGRTTWEELSRHEPHYLFPSLKETSQIMEAILSGA